MNRRRIRNLLIALAALGFAAAATLPAQAMMCKDGWCPWW